MERLTKDLAVAWSAAGHFLESIVVLLLTLVISLLGLLVFVLSWIRLWVESKGKVPKWLRPGSLVSFFKGN